MAFNFFKNFLLYFIGFIVLDFIFKRFTIEISLKRLIIFAIISIIIVLFGFYKKEKHTK